MKIIISAQGVKREITGPYSVCGSTEDFARLRDALSSFLDRGSCFGWVEVTERPPTVANQPPEPWVTKSEVQP